MSKGWAGKTWQQQRAEEENSAAQWQKKGKKYKTDTFKALRSLYGALEEKQEKGEEIQHA